MIRSLNGADLNQLMAIENAVQIAPWSREIFLRCLNSGYIGWVEELDSKVRGFILISLQFNECHVLNLCVRPENQRQGLGQALLKYALSEIKKQGFTLCYLEVRRSNLSAINLYEKIGFNQIADRKNYYPALLGREDALIFAKDLTVED